MNEGTELQPGMYVDIEWGKGEKRGYIKRILPQKKHQSEVWVELHSGEEGYVTHLVTKEEYKREKFKYYNLFLYAKGIVTIADKRTKELYVEVIYHPKSQKRERTAFLFSDEKAALTFLLKLGEDRLALKRISRKKTLIENFPKGSIDKFHINNERKISPQKLDEYERKFKQFS